MSTLTVGTISEKVSGAGVAVDGVTLKDGQLGTSASSVPINSSSLNGGQFGGRRNIVINGSMQCWQRATSASSIGYTSVDRWSYYAPSSLAISRSTDVPTGFQYAASVGGGGDASGLTQKIEASTCKQLVGATITVSFYLKQTTGAGTDKIAVALSRANSEDNFGSSTSISTQTISTTTSYARYTCTFTSLPAEVANGLQITIKSNGAGSVVYLITGVQCEVGQVTNFEHLSFGETLQLCKRYAYVAVAGQAYAHFGGGFSASGTLAYADVPLPVEMRINPAVTTNGTFRNYAHDGGRPITSGPTVLNAGSKTRVSFQSTSGPGMTAGHFIFLGANNDADAFMTFDAEIP